MPQAVQQVGAHDSAGSALVVEEVMAVLCTAFLLLWRLAASTEMEWSSQSHQHYLLGEPRNDCLAPLVAHDSHFWLQSPDEDVLDVVVSHVQFLLCGGFPFKEKERELRSHQHLFRN